MALTGTPLWLLLVVLVLVLPVVTLLAWSRVPGPAVGRTLARLGMLLACQLLAVLCLAVSANDYGYFYGSWSDLFANVGLVTGGSSQFPATNPVLSGKTDSPYGRLVVRRHPYFSSPAQYRTRGKLVAVRIGGPASHLSGDAYVYLPPQYFQARYAHTSFPASMVITGYPSTNRMLLKRLQMHKALLNDIQQHRAAPMILVMMRPDVTYPRDTECTDVPAGPMVETYLAQDIPTVIGHHYRVNPRGWGAIGVSTGGYCATKLAMTYPTTFHAAASISGYYTTLHDQTTGDLWGGSAVLRNLNDPTWRLAHMPVPPVSLLLTSSQGERGVEGLPNMQRFVALAKPPMSISTLVERSGGHNFNTWGSEIPMALSWLSAHIPGPSSGPSAKAQPPHGRTATGVRILPAGSTAHTGPRSSRELAPAALRPAGVWR